MTGRNLTTLHPLPKMMLVLPKMGNSNDPTGVTRACLLTLLPPPCYPWAPLPSAQIKHWEPAGLQSLKRRHDRQRPQVGYEAEIEPGSPALQVNSLPAELPAAAAAKSLQSCLTLCNPIDGSPPVSPVPGILQARTLEWVAISFSNA